MAKRIIPNVYVTEIDNTVRTNSVPGAGVGAIVFKSNKGPVNQRRLTTSYDNFTSIYGEPENEDDYGHFAAENYLAISNQLLTVRATMGDEGYAQVQFPYTDADADDTYRSDDTSEFKYVDNEGNSNLKLISKLDKGYLIEEVIKDYLPKEYININFKYVDDNTREITFSSNSEFYNKIIGELHV